MFGLGIWEIAFILIIALLVLGPEKLPKVAKQLGRGMRELRKAASEFQTNLNEASNEPASSKPTDKEAIAPPDEPEKG